METIKLESNYNTQPLFFQNDQVSKSTYLIQKAESLDVGKYILKVWNELHYNIYDTTKELQDYSINIYIQKDQSFHKVFGQEDDSKNIIKVEDEFYCLLKI